MKGYLVSQECECGIVHKVPFSRDSDETYVSMPIFICKMCLQELSFVPSDSKVYPIREG